jgi:hypothetical protein
LRLPDGDLVGWRAQKPVHGAASLERPGDLEAFQLEDQVRRNGGWILGLGQGHDGRAAYVGRDALARNLDGGEIDHATLPS